MVYSGNGVDMTNVYLFNEGKDLIVSDIHSGVESTETVISLSLLEQIKEVMWEMVYEIEAEANERYKDESGEFFHPPL